jgi:lysine-ketoglutarate reductase/saccharopine dehydrogenase-like protein (TIGR00300 family)
MTRPFMSKAKPFVLPSYMPPDFTLRHLESAPCAGTRKAPADGMAPDNFHATSIFPEYIRLEGRGWVLLERSRMDCTVVIREGECDVIEMRRLRKGDDVLVGRTENGEEGIFVHAGGFSMEEASSDKFSFRTRHTRETPFSRDYDSLYELLKYERKEGRIVWVLGPAISFDHDSRMAMTGLIESGYAHAICAGNALATHDIEAALSGTGLGQDIYTKEHRHLGHYNHLDAINTVRRNGSIRACCEKGILTDGIIHACIRNNVPFVLAGSIRDDGPLPEVIADAYRSQDEMRGILSEATTVIALATQLHSIAAGNLLPSYTVARGAVRPVYFFIVDVSEFALDKLANRGSLQARGIVTNVQDFLINVSRSLE